MIKIFFLLLISCTIFAQASKISTAKTYFEAKKFTEAKQLLKNIDDEQADYAAARYYLGRIAYEEKEYEDAADYFEEATEADGKVADYFNWLGNALGTIAQDANPIRQGMLAPKMKSAWESAIALDSKNLEARKSLIEYYTLAPGFMGGSFEKAHDVAKQIKKLNLAEGHLAEGRIFVREEKFAEAEKEFVAMTKANADYNSALANFYVTRKQYDKAFTIYDELLLKDAQNMQTVYQLGRLSALSGTRLAAGEAHLKKYLAYQPKAGEPSHAGAYMRLGNIYEKKGDKAGAKKAYETSLKMDASLQEAKDGLGRVK
ncbi:MAG: tetratricopeptide repeat protein [Cytophagia bacterium]|nr:tetratricopeptide repeat protein [Cytophagia bacterium]